MKKDQKTTTSCRIFIALAISGIAYSLLNQNQLGWEHPYTMSSLTIGLASINFYIVNKNYAK